MFSLKKEIHKTIINTYIEIKKNILLKIEDLSSKLDLLTLRTARVVDIKNMLEIENKITLSNLNHYLSGYDSRGYLEIQKVETPSKAYPYYYSIYIRDYEKIYDGEDDMRELQSSIQSDMIRDEFCKHIMLKKVENKKEEVKSLISKITSSDYLNMMDDVKRRREKINGK